MYSLRSLRASYSGSTAVSKTASVGPIPTARATKIAITAIFCYAIYMDSRIIEFEKDRFVHYKFAAVSVAFVYCLYYISTRLSWHFIDNVNLIIHEAGHVLFLPFGNTLTVAGGSILQVLVPIIFFAYFFLNTAIYSAAVMAFWTGVSMVNVSVYAGDALKMQLPLLTGDTDGHDWNQLLFQFGLLRQTDLVSNIILILGILCILAGFTLALVSWLKNFKN